MRIRTAMRLLAAMTAVAWAVAGAAPALAEDRYVPADYPTIQAAIDASSPGDNVIVSPGTYSGPGNVDLDIGELTVRSETGNPAECVIDCQYGALGFRAAGSVVDGFTITHAYRSGSVAAAEIVSTSYIAGCNFIDNQVAGIAIEGDTLVEGCQFRNNSPFGAATDGGYLQYCEFESNSVAGIYGQFYSAFECTFKSNPYGVWPQSSVLCEACIFQNNAVAVLGAKGYFSGSYQGNGIGLFLDFADSADVSAEFEANEIAIQLSAVSGLEVFDSKFVRNGAAILGDESNWLRVWRSYFLGNSGWAVDLGKWQDAVAVNCVFVGNGGGVRFEGGDEFIASDQVYIFLSTMLANAGGALVGKAVQPDGWTMSMHSIVWGNGPQDFIGTSAAVCDVSTTPPFGGGNISLPPNFVRESSPGPDGAWGTPDDDYGDLHLRPDSPCINRGGDTLDPVYEQTDFDIEGKWRLVGAQYDLGAYEFPFGLQLFSLSRTSAKVGGYLNTITATGIFPDGCLLTWNGVPVQTARVSKNTLRMVLTPEQISRAGVHQIAVWTGLYDDPYGPQNDWSNPIIFTVLNPTPAIFKLNPASVVHGSPGFTLEVTGDRFVETSVVWVNGAPRETTFVGTTSLSVEIGADEVANVGKLAVTVVNPEPGGGASSVKYLSIK